MISFPQLIMQDLNTLQCNVCIYVNLCGVYVQVHVFYILIACNCNPQTT